jgi:hypothetical protein
MDRRTFLLLTGAGSTALLGSPRHVTTPPHERRAGRLRFELDEGRRWSLWYLGDGSPVPLILNATLGAWIADQFLTLGDLEYSTVGSRRPPGGDAVVVRGRAGGTYLEAELLAGPPAVAPLATVSLSVYPDRDLPSVKGVRFFQAPAAEIMPGVGELVALVNGSHSSAGVRLMALPPRPRDGSPEIASHGALGLVREARSLALAFDSDDPGEGKVNLSTEGLDALSAWAPARPLRPDGDTSRLRLCYQPDGDGVEALRALFVPTSQVDRERLAATLAPAGWSSGRDLRASLTEADVINHTDFCAEQFDPRFLQLIELGEGYQRAAGDWDTNDRFSHGHRWLTDQIHSRRFQAGLWLAPFGVSEQCGIPAAHPDWLVRNPESDAPAVLETREDWGGRVYALDAAHPAARQWLFDLAHRVVGEWGYNYIRLDRLRWASLGGAHYGGLTPAEACRLGLGALRDGAGSNAFLLGGDAPLQHSVGFVNGMRIGPDRDGGWGGIQAPARAAALRSFYHRSVWLNDPDTLTVGPPLSLAEAQVWTSIVAVSGDITVLSDDLLKLDPERLALLARALPVAPSTGRPIGAARDEPDVADRPASIWIAEGAPRWWTVVLANWEDEAMPQSVSLAALGLAGARFNAYDVWRAAPLPDLTRALTAQLDPHSCITVGIRPAAARPQIIGTTRHVVQGAVDVVDETWDAVTRTLRARATNLDRRAYGVTIAVPKGMRPGTWKADVPCSVRRLESGHAVLEWAAGAGGNGSDVGWEIRFRRVGAPGKD